MRGVATADRVRAFLAALARSTRRPSTVYLVGGTTAVIEGWRESTVDIDLRLEPDHDELLRAIAKLKNELGINVELASPDLFVPVASGWPDRSPWVATEGSLTIRHFDLTAQALAKLERGHARDLADVGAMVERGLITRRGVLQAFEAIADQIYRYPALDERAFRSAVTRWAQSGDG